MRIDIWSDYLCPYCYLGGERLNKALKKLDMQVEVYHHAFELNPANIKLSLIEMMTQKFGMSHEEAIKSSMTMAKVFEKEGLEYNWKKMRYAGTRKAHELTKYAETMGLGDRVHASLLDALFAKGYDLDNIDSLVEIAKEAGLDPDKSKRALETKAYAKAVEEDLALVEKYAITGVPFYIFKEKYSISGALEVEDFMQLLGEVQRLG